MLLGKHLGERSEPSKRTTEEQLEIIKQISFNTFLGVNKLMSQLDDLKTAVANELSDVQTLLAKLQTLTSNDPTVSAIVSQLQASHNAVQAVLNPAPATTQAPAVATPAS